jgi:hypothetical protein
MGTMPPKELLILWTRDDIPVEMAVGHLVQNLVKLQTAVEVNRLEIYQLQTTLENLVGKDMATQKITISNE